MSIFSKQNSIQQDSGDLAKNVIATENTQIHQKRTQDKAYTPVIGKKKMDLYKLSIIQNASKFSNQVEKALDDNKVEEVKQNDIAKIRNALTETLKEQKTQVGEVTRSKTANLKQIMAQDNSSNLQLSKDNTEIVFFSARKLLFGPGIDDKTLHRHVTLILRGLNYSLKLLKGPPMSYIESRQITLKELKSIKPQFFTFKLLRKEYQNFIA